MVGFLVGAPGVIFVRIVRPQGFAGCVLILERSVRSTGGGIEMRVIRRRPAGPNILAVLTAKRQLRTNQISPSATQEHIFRASFKK